MFPKLVTVYSGRKRPRKVVYLRLVDRVRVNGRWKERALVNLGRQDALGRKALGELLKKLRRFTDEILVTPEEIEGRHAKDYGAVLVGQKLWQEIGMDKWITECCGEPLPLSLGEPGVLAMVLNRLTSPRSKLALYDWMPGVYLPHWEGDGFDLPKDPKQYAERFYQTMDWLVKGKNKEKIEECLAAWARTLFAVEVVFYDITNVQFEGWQELKQARFGNIKLGRRNHKQILLGLVMVEGLPVACHIFRGNRAEKTSLWWVREKLKKQFNVGRIVFVCDRGMISAANLAEIEVEKDGYIVALKRRRCKEVEPLLEEDEASFTPIRISKDGELLLSAWEAPQEEAESDEEKAGKGKKRKKKRGKRLDVVFNAVKVREKKRAAVIRELEQKLEGLRSQVRSGKLKKVKEIVAAAEEILSHKHGKRYFRYDAENDGEFEFSPNEVSKRRIVAFNPVKAREEKKKRAAVIQELEQKLEGLRSRVISGKLNKVKGIVAAAERILSHKHGKRYFRYDAKKDGDFEFFPNEKGRALEEKLDGRFVIKTTEKNLSLKEVVFKYKDLMDVEDAVRDLKDFIHVAPVRHWRYRRVKAHIFICMKALLLERYLDQKLKKAGLDYSARKAIEKLKNIKVLGNQVGPLTLKYVTPPDRELGKILAACGVFKLPKILSEPREVLTKPGKPLEKP